MKSILLTTTAIVAFAGVAAADGHTAIDFSGSAVLGHNSEELTPDVDADDDVGFYSELNLDVTMSATLDNGITVTGVADVDELDAAEGGTAAGVTLTIASDDASIVYGDTTFAAEDFATAVGSMDADGEKAEQDGELVLKGTVAMGGVNAAVSYELEDVAGATENTGNLSLGAGATFGIVSAAIAYQTGAEDALTTAAQHESIGVKASASVAGADLSVGYYDDSTDDLQSTGFGISYPVGPVTLDASYVMEAAGVGSPEDNWDIKASYAAGAMTANVYTDEDENWGVEGTYAVSDALSLAAGITDAGEDTYVGGTYDLGGGGSLLVSYADDADSDEAAGDNDIGDAGYQVGTTIQVSFSF